MLLLLLSKTCMDPTMVDGAAAALTQAKTLQHSVANFSGQHLFTDLAATAKQTDAAVEAFQSSLFKLPPKGLMDSLDKQKTGGSLFSAKLLRMSVPVCDALSVFVFGTPQKCEALIKNKNNNSFV